MNRRAFLSAAAATALNLGPFNQSFAQLNSSRPIRLISGAPSGGAVDTYARLVADHMTKTLARPVILENKPGASGNVGAQFVVNAPADGNLIFIATQAWAEINPSSHSDLKWTLDDFIPLMRGVTAPLVLVTNPGVPARTLSDLVAWIRSNPGKLNYSSYNAGTPSHFLGYQLNERFGLDLVHVPARGSGPQATDLMAGHVLFGFGQVQSTLPLIEGGKLNAIAVTSTVRSRFLPNSPTFAELGYPEFTANIWFGLMARSGTPPAVVQSLLAAAKAAHADPEVKKRLEAQGFDVSVQTDPEFSADIKRQAARWARLVKASGFRASD